MTFSLSGILGASSAGYASEVERSIAPSGLFAPLAAPVAVPAVVPVTPSLPPVLPPAVVPVTAKASFASLADAVAGQEGQSEDEHVRCLASAVYFESKGEPLAGQLAVAQVILNRTRSGRYPPSVCGVVTQRGQFSFVRGGAIPPVRAGLAYRTAVAVAQVAMAQAWNAPAPDALFFNGARASHSGTRRVALIGNHAFYR